MKALRRIDRHPSMTGNLTRCAPTYRSTVSRRRCRLIRPDAVLAVVPMRIHKALPRRRRNTRPANRRLAIHNRSSGHTCSPTAPTGSAAAAEQPAASASRLRPLQRNDSEQQQSTPSRSPTKLSCLHVMRSVRQMVYAYLLKFAVCDCVMIMLTLRLTGQVPNSVHDA